MQPVEIRTLHADDWAVWREVRLRALADAPDAFGSKLADWQGDNDREARWRARFDGVAFNAVATVGVTVVGAVGGTHTGIARSVELISMWVDPDVRGVGVGEALIEAVIEWARSASATTVSLAVRRGNGHAIALYERTAFERVGPAPGDADEDLMIRRLEVSPRTAG